MSNRSHRGAVWAARLLILSSMLVLMLALAACGGANETAEPAADTATADVAEQQTVAPAGDGAADQLAATEAPAEAAPTEALAAEPTEAPAEAPSSEGEKLDACELLTAADAEAFLGIAPGEPSRPVEGEALFVVSSCSYRSDDNKISLITTTMADGNAEANKTSFQADRSRAVDNYGVEGIDVAGLGEEAYWVSNPDSYINSLMILQGPTQLVLSTNLDEKTEAPPSALVELAQTILSRMP